MLFQKTERRKTAFALMKKPAPPVVERPSPEIHQASNTMCVAFDQDSGRRPRMEAPKAYKDKSLIVRPHLVLPTPTDIRDQYALA
jgi:hypothetical protein